MVQDRWAIDFETSDRHLEAGDESLIYYHQINKFVSQSVKIEERSENGPLLRMVMKLVGEATSAETRWEFRVFAIDTGLSVSVDTEDRCTVHDISMSGLGVICRQNHSIGQPFDVTIRYEDDEFSGRMQVQYGRELDVGRTRYGLRGLFEPGDGSPLRSGLTRTALAIHRQRLQSVAGSV